MSDMLIGKTLGGYKLEKLLGQGGMARVYQATHPKTGERTAIKVVEPEKDPRFDYTARFDREARAIRKLKHPHVVRFHKSGKARGVLYMVMSYVEGSDLAQILQRYQKQNAYMPYEDVVRIVTDMGAALDYIHQQGIIHRDVKPSNIMIDKNGQAILTDFGLALLAEVGTKGEIFGTPRYISPEQAISSAKVVPQSDIYSLGVVAYEMLTGRAPFEAENSMDTAMMHMAELPPSPRQFRRDLSPALEKVLIKALEKNSQERYHSGAALASDLATALNLPSPAASKKTLSRSSKAQGASDEQPPTNKRFRYRLLMLALLVLILLLIAFAIMNGMV